MTLQYICRCYTKAQGRSKINFCWLIAFVCQFIKAPRTNDHFTFFQRTCEYEFSSAICFGEITLASIFGSDFPEHQPTIQQVDAALLHKRTHTTNHTDWLGGGGHNFHQNAFTCSNSHSEASALCGFASMTVRMTMTTMIMCSISHLRLIEFWGLGCAVGCAGTTDGRWQKC